MVEIFTVGGGEYIVNVLNAVASWTGAGGYKSLIQVTMVMGLALAVIVWLAGYEAMAGRLKAGEFVSLMTAMMAMLPSLKRITNVQSMIQRGVSAADLRRELGFD